MPTIISRYDCRDIYSADEFGLFYKALPTKSMHLKGEKCSGVKNSKIQLTGLATGNICGEKIPTFVIGKSKKPRCFKGIKSTLWWAKKELDGLQIIMDSEQYRKFALEGRKVALVIDNCTTLPNIENLKSITLCFLPPNTIVSFQPMDQGFIWSLKCK